MNVSKGNELRTFIANMLRMKHLTVIEEYQLCTTTADIFYIDSTNGVFPQKIAIEAKNWEGGITSGQLSNIYNLYAPSLNMGEIDRLWIVGKKALASQPRSAVSKLERVQYSTIDEFTNSLMNFSQLIQANLKTFENHEVYANYIPLRCSGDGILLDDVIDAWLHTKTNGLVITGGYGTGKTTYSYYMAKKFSEAHLSDTSKRIPIRISLGGLYAKQDLMALICSALNGNEAGYIVPNFSYNTFLEMNRLGRLLLILDGFDEMRHAMNFDDFIFIFEQMKPFFTGLSKTIILGRPDSFLTNNEEERAMVALVDGSRFLESNVKRVEIDFFSVQEIKRYIENYLKMNSILSEDKSRERINEIVDNTISKDHSILTRPVQLKMFTSIMDRLPLDSDTISRYELYQNFIYQFVIREDQKSARRSDSKDITRSEFRKQRIEFMQKMAWWVLSEKKENRFTVTEIPLSIAPPTLRFKYNASETLREALIGSVIEPIQKTLVIDGKPNRYFYFPHKSYVEFLVADYFVDSWSTVSAVRFTEYLNSEIISFIRERAASERALEESNHPDFILSTSGKMGYISPLKRLRDCIPTFLGQDEPYIIDVCIEDNQILEEIRVFDSYETPSDIILHYKYIKKNNIGAQNYLMKKLNSVRSTESTYCVLCCILNELTEISSDFLFYQLFSELFRIVFTGRVRSLLQGEIVNFRIFDKGALLALLFEKAFKADSDVVSIELANMHQVITLSSRFNYLNTINAKFYRRKITSPVHLEHVEIVNFLKKFHISEHESIGFEDNLSRKLTMADVYIYLMKRYKDKITDVFFPVAILI